MFKEKIDQFHLYINGERNKLSNFRSHFLFFKTLFKGLVWDIMRMANVRRNRNFQKPYLYNKVVIHVNTLNNLNALIFLRSRYPDAVWTSVGGFVGKGEDVTDIRRGYKSNPTLIKYVFLLYLYVSSKYGTKMAELIKRNYFYIGYFQFLYQNNKPKTIFISNDHTPSSRALILAAKKMGIRTVYLQHACVTGIFPPLRFSYSFLYGSHSRSVYEKIGNIEGEIFTVGNPVFDEYNKAITEKKISFKIGVAYNTLDNLDDVEYLVKELEKEVVNSEIWLRPHPADGRKIHFGGNFTISNSKVESSREFLKEMDIVVAGNTSLLLEAACMSVLPLQYDFSQYDQYLSDYYGFVQNGLAIRCFVLKDVLDRIRDFYEQKYDNIRNRAIPFDSSISSDFEFHVKEKIFDLLDQQSI